MDKRRGVVLAALAAVLLSACTSSPSHGSDARETKPTKVIPGPAGLIAGTAPQLNGDLWVLAGTLGIRTLHQLDLTTDTFGPALPATGSATSLTQSSSTLLGLGLASSLTGAVEFVDGATGATISTVAVGGPVREVTAGSDGSTFYALDGSSHSATVSAVSSITNTVKSVIPVPGDTISIAVDPNQQRIYALESDGDVSIVSVPGKVLSRFPVGSNPKTLALSGDGDTMYVLKGTANGTENVGVINVSLESQTKALPAPTGTTDIAVSSDGATLYAFVGTPSVGNVQLFSTG